MHSYISVQGIEPSSSFLYKGMRGDRRIYAAASSAAGGSALESSYQSVRAQRTGMPLDLDCMDIHTASTTPEHLAANPSNTAPADGHGGPGSAYISNSSSSVGGQRNRVYATNVCGMSSAEYRAKTFGSGSVTGPSAQPVTVGLSQKSDSFARPEEFEEMVGDLRRVFISWLKKTDAELKTERENLVSDKKKFEAEKAKAWETFIREKEAELQHLIEERRKVAADCAAAMKTVAVEREETRARLEEERRKFEKETDLWKRQLAQGREKLLSEIEAFEEMKKKVVDINVAAQTMVDINVGGVVFETSRHTLTQQPGSLLEGIVGGRHRVSRDRNGRIFVDRDSELFRTILQFLREPNVPPCPQNATESVALCSEADFYGIKFFPFPLGTSQSYFRAAFAIGGHNGVDHLNTVEFLDVAYKCWRSCASLDTPRTYLAVGYLPGRIYAYGGQNFEYKALCDVECYDILRDCWVGAPRLNVPRRNLCGTSLGGRVYAVGGYDGASILSSVEAYDPRMRNWMELAPLTVARSSASCAAVGDSLLAVGGTCGDRLRSVEKYDPRAGKWELLPMEMLAVRSACCAVTCLGNLYAFGGTDASHEILGSCEVYDASADPREMPPLRRYYNTALRGYSNKIFAINATRFFVPQKWMFLRQLPQARMDAGAASTSGSILVTGGQSESVLASATFYRPDLDDWQDGPSMLTPRYGHGLLVANI